MWFDGLFAWKWNVGVVDRDRYSPQGKPAADIMSWWIREQVFDPDSGTFVPIGAEYYS